MQSSGDTRPKRVHYPALDGLRGIAVLLVMLLHFSLFSPSGLLENGLFLAMGTGWIGVDLFFVLSGFLITGILVDTRDDPHYFRNFYARRTLRIFPLYYAYLLLLFVALPAFSEAYAAEHATNDRRWWLWLYLGNILMGMTGWEGMPSHTTHLWSLAIEEQFYLVWPLLVYLVPRRRMLALCIATFFLAPLTRAYLATQGSWDAIYVFTPARVDTLAAGAMIAIILRDHGADAVRRPCARFAQAGGLLLAIGVGWTFANGSRALLPTLDFGTQQFAYPGLALTFAAVIGWAVTGAPGSSLVRGLTRPGLLVLGKYSYALYLVHVPLRNVVRIVVNRVGLPEVLGSQLPAQIALTAAGVALSLGLSLISWNLLEKPILRLKRHFEATTHAPPPAAAPATQSS